MQLLDHLGIAREAAWIQFLHLVGQITDFFRSQRIVLHHPTKLAQLLHALLIKAFIIGRIAGCIGWNWLLSSLVIAIVTSIDVAEDGAISPPPAIAYIATDFATLVCTISS